MVNSTWTAPGGATLSGSNPSSYRSTLNLFPVLTGTYACVAYVGPGKSAFIGGSSGSKGIESKDDNYIFFVCSYDSHV